VQEILSAFFPKVHIFSRYFGVIAGTLLAIWWTCSHPTFLVPSPIDHKSRAKTSWYVWHWSRIMNESECHENRSGYPYTA
jgi:hypothetical protein